MAGFDQRATGFTEYLQTEVGKDHRQDALYSGYIQAVKDLLLVDLDSVGEQ